MQTVGDQPAEVPGLNQVTIPDLWQQEAVAALRQGQDVVVQAPTGSGKTLIFELWSNQGRNRGQAIYTVPTRALANDKLAEWRARGWNVGIATGDLSDNLEAPIIVATLETQKNRLIRGDGPALLVVDEYQMLGDPERGLNYELALALAPGPTQLLLLSGSVSNPHHVVKWLTRLGRQVRLVRHEERPVPLEEVFANNLNYHLPREIRGYWPRFMAKALAEGLGPVLLFAPRRAATEAIAGELSRQLPNQHPLELSEAQRLLVGENLAKLLRARVAYHHSGLSYGVRAGVIEPLAKAGQLRVVVATMGLAAGINFSMRSVALAGESYRRDQVEHPLRPDELLQMFGRAGRRGIDHTGYFLVSANGIRMREGYPAHLSRSGMVDWSALLSVMAGAAAQGEEPFLAAVKVQERLFTTKPIHLGVESSLRHPDTPCGLRTDAERARHVRRKVREMLNSRGEWERLPAAEDRPAGEVRLGPALKAFRPPATEGNGPPVLRPVLTLPEALEKLGHGTLVPLADTPFGPELGRSLLVAELLKDDRVLLAKWLRRLLNWHGRQVDLATWRSQLAPRVIERLARQHQPVVRLEEKSRKIVAVVRLAEQPLRVPVDRHGVPLWHPEERQVAPPDCAGCALVETCRQLPAATGTALLWKRLGLVDDRGVPTRRGRILSCFSGDSGLAIAAALEDESYPLEELVYDLANLDAGFRFCREDDRLAGRLAMVCRQVYGFQSVPGYLENGVPPGYGSGAEAVVAGIHRNPLSKHGWVTEFLGDGDIDRVIIEWRSLLRQVAHAPALEWERWTEFQRRARAILNETESPTLTELPRLGYHQSRRIEHRLVFRRH